MRRAREMVSSGCSSPFGSGVASFDDELLTSVCWSSEAARAASCVGAGGNGFEVASVTFAGVVVGGTLLSLNPHDDGGNSNFSFFVFFPPRLFSFAIADTVAFVDFDFVCPVSLTSCSKGPVFPLLLSICPTATGV